jgi:hypothetical protein
MGMKKISVSLTRLSSRLEGTHGAEKWWKRSGVKMIDERGRERSEEEIVRKFSLIDLRPDGGFFSGN